MGRPEPIDPSEACGALASAGASPLDPLAERSRLGRHRERKRQLRRQTMSAARRCFVWLRLDQGQSLVQLKGGLGAVIALAHDTRIVLRARQRPCPAISGPAGRTSDKS